MDKMCPICKDEKMIVVNFKYDRVISEILETYTKDRYMCVYCGYQEDVENG